MGRTRKHKIIDPEGKERDSAARRQNHTDQTNGVLSPLVKESRQNLNDGFRAHVALSLRMTEYRALTFRRYGHDTGVARGHGCGNPVVKSRSLTSFAPRRSRRRK